MSTLEKPAANAGAPLSDSLVQPSLPKFAELIAGVLAVAVSGLLTILLGWNVAGFAAVALVIYVVVVPAWSSLIEGRRASVDRLVTTLVWASVAIALVPLVWLIVTVLKNGASVIDWHFLSTDLNPLTVTGTKPGGIVHAIVGTLMVTLVASIISIPIGLMAAIYLVEYGAKSKLAKAITFLVDVMTGIPSIVAGLFALALFVLIFGPQERLGFGGSVAISLLMIPIVVRATEEMLRLVPGDLREASYALGVPKWRTIMKVVVPTALGGIVTGVTLAISRVIGETAPLLIIAGAPNITNWNPFHDRMQTLPVFIYTQYGVGLTRGQVGASQTPLDRAWGAALVLIIIVMLLNVVARVIGKIFSPKKG